MKPQEAAKAAPTAESAEAASAPALPPPKPDPKPVFDLSKEYFRAELDSGEFLHLV